MNVSSVLDAMTRGLQSPDAVNAEQEAVRLDRYELRLLEQAEAHRRWAATELPSPMPETQAEIDKRMGRLD